MCKDAIVFSNEPKGVILEAGHRYYICQCGWSENGVFCDGHHESSDCPTTCLPKRLDVEETKEYHICMCKSSKKFPFCDGTHDSYTKESIGQKVTQWESH